MKKITLLFVSLLVLVFTSCEKIQSQPLVSQSPGGKLEITVSASRYSSLDPWVVAINISKTGEKKSDYTVTQEVMAESITDENVNFNWLKASKCNITITQADGDVVTIPVSVSGI